MNKKTGMLLVVLMVLLIMPMVNAEIDYSYRCYGSKLAKEADFTIGNDVYALNNTIVCDYGCDVRTNMCRPPPLQGYVYAGIIVLVIICIGGLLYKVI